jgi:hypothetical protein
VPRHPTDKGFWLFGEAPSFLWWLWEDDIKCQSDKDNLKKGEVVNREEHLRTQDKINKTLRTATYYELPYNCPEALAERCQNVARFVHERN